MPEIDGDTPIDPILARFTGMRRDELVAELKKREMPFNGSGTNPDLVRRLVDYEKGTGVGGEGVIVDEDDDDLLGESQVPQFVPSGDLTGRSGTEEGEVARGTTVATGGGISRYQKVFVVGDLTISDEQHFQMIRKTHEAAEAAGYHTRGGGLAAIRVGFGSKQGMRTAIYEVSVRKRAR